MSNVDQLTIGEVKRWRAKAEKANFVGELHQLGRELANEHNLTINEAITVLMGNILNEEQRQLYS